MKTLRLLSLVLLTFLSGVAYSNLAMTERDANIQDTRRQYDGFAVVAKPRMPQPLPLFEAPFHDPISGASVRVREDGVELSLPRSNLADIVALGGGRWSAWNGEIYYSSLRNNEEPLTSGRFYSASYRPVLTSEFTIIYSFGLLSFLLAWLRPSLQATKLCVRAHPRTSLFGGAAASLALAAFLFSWTDSAVSDRARDNPFEMSNLGKPIEDDYFFASKPSLHGKSDQRLQRGEGESVLAFAQRISRLVFEANEICRPSYGGSFLLAVHDFLNTGDPILRNQKRLSLTGRLQCGQCGQYAAFTSSVLRAEGLNAKPVGLLGHIVVELRVPGGVVFFDPTVGIGPLEYDGNRGSLIERALIEYSALPEYQRLGVFYKNVDQRVEYLKSDVIDERIAFEENLDLVQHLTIAGLTVIGGVLFAAGLLYRIGPEAMVRA